MKFTRMGLILAWVGLLFFALTACSPIVELPIEEDEAGIAEQEAEEILDVQDAAGDKYQELQQIGDPEAVQATISWLELQTNVKETQVNSENDIFILYDCGLIGAIFSDKSNNVFHSQDFGNNFPNLNQKPLSKQFSPVSSNVNTPGSDKAIFLAFNEAREPEQQLIDFTQIAGFITEKCTGRDFSLQKMEGLGSYGLIWIQTHSGPSDLADWTNGVLSRTIWIMSGEKPDSDILADVWTDFRSGIGIGTKNGESYFMVNQRFINNLSFDNSIIFNNGCSSLKYDSMADAFLDAGAATYFGWTDTSYKFFVDEVSAAMFEKLKLSGATVSEAYQATSIRYDEWDRSYSIDELYPITIYKDNDGDDEGRWKYANGKDIGDADDYEKDFTVDFQYKGSGSFVLNPTNAPPTVGLLVRNQEGPPPLTVDFDASSSNDDDGEIVSYEWDFGDGKTGNGAKVSHTYSNPGTYTATITVTDNDGATNQTSAEINVNAKPDLSISTVSSSESTIRVKDTISVTFTVENNGGAIESAFKNRVFLSTSQYGGSGQQIPIQDFPMTLNGTASKTETVDVTIPQVPSGDWWMAVFTDCDEIIDEATEGNNINSAEITIRQGEKESPNAAFNASPTSGPAPLTVDFDASISTDPDGTIEEYAWDFGDGTTGSGKNPSHTYNNEGTYTATLTVTDNDGLTDQASEQINVTSGPIFKIVEFDVPSTVKINTQITIHYAIKNTGDEEGTRTITLTIEDSAGNIDHKVSQDKTINPDAVFSEDIKYTFTTADAYTVILNTQDDQKSETIQVSSNKSPTATINSPSDNSTFTKGESIHFSGEATDPEDGPLTGSSLVWTSDIDGQIGTGESFYKGDLSVGSHTIKFTATDSGGKSTTVSIAITIVESDKLFPDPNLEQAVREKINKPTGKLKPSDVDNIVQLDVGMKDIKNLTGLEYCTNLQKLNIANNPISNIAPLAGLTNLEVLEMASVRTTDISPLSGLTNLKEFYCQANDVRDISPLSNLTSLRILLLQWNGISDVSPLSGLTNLEELELSSQNISDISPLSGLTNLTFLSIRSGKVKDISPLSNLTSLRKLIIRGNDISDISPLSNLTRLELLYIDLNRISDISPLTKLLNLTSLDCSDNKITDIQSLVNNDGLDEGDRLYIENNYLDLSPGSDDMQNIQTLIDRGVDVEYEPQK